AALMGVGEVNLRSDLQYERFRTPRPRNLWAQLLATPGLGTPKTFGDPVPNKAIAKLPLIDEVALGTPPDAADPPPVAAFPVERPRDIVRAEDANGVMLMAGDGEGIVDAAAAGLISTNQPVLYSASFANDPAEMQRALDDGAHLVLTDTNRRQARRWGTVRENVGVTERAGETPLVSDPTDNRLDVFPGAGDTTKTTVEQRGVARVDATAYGNPVSYTPDDRPANAIDGDPRTAWRVGAFSDVRGERWEVELTGPATTDHITLLQPINGSRNRFITKVRLKFDGRDPMDVALDISSRSQPGQTIDIGKHTFTTLSIEILDTDIGYRPSYKGISPVGFAELDVAGAKVDEVIHLPTDLLTAAGPASIDHPLDVVMTRQRSNPAEPARTDDEETSIQRAFDLPTSRSFTVEGDARLSARAPDTVLDELLGRPDATQGGVTATSTARLDGDLSALASSAIDGDPATAWQTPFAFVQGNVATYTSANPFTFDHLDLVVFADGRHSVPTELTITADDGKPVVVPVAPITDDPSHENATASQRVDLPAPITAKKVAIQLSGIRPVTTIDYYSETPVTMPVAIAEWGIEGLSVPPLAPTVDTGCQPLLHVNGEAVDLRATGKTSDVLARNAMTLAQCGGGNVSVPSGEVRVGTAVGKDAGVDLDRVVLRSGPGGAALTTAPAATGAAPTVTVKDEGRVSDKLQVDNATKPFWLVLGQSQNDGWKARVKGAGSLGAPTLIDGYANGWYVTPTGSGPIEITLTWAPQRIVWIAIGLSTIALVVSLGLIAVAWARRRRVATADEPAPELATWQTYRGTTPRG
ncbi:MAG TPA: alpha-(1-_3)-arabinofuranosyltransferase family protein, partial [Acidimicrobiales bacterium]|nr:alpha-(1->3)-arabinofuranosyltransferase family protein [Acidimicrobiales bacterium]